MYVHILRSNSLREREREIDFYVEQKNSFQSKVSVNPSTCSVTLLKRFFSFTVFSKTKSIYNYNFYPYKNLPFKKKKLRLTCKNLEVLREVQLKLPSIKRICFNGLQPVEHGEN